MSDQIAGGGGGKCNTWKMPDHTAGGNAGPGKWWTYVDWNLRDWKMQDLSSRAVDGHQMYSGRK